MINVLTSIGLHSLWLLVLLFPALGGHFWFFSLHHILSILFFLKSPIFADHSFSPTVSRVQWVFSLMQLEKTSKRSYLIIISHAVLQCSLLLGWQLFFQFTPWRINALISQILKRIIHYQEDLQVKMLTYFSYISSSS